MTSPKTEPTGMDVDSEQVDGEQDDGGQQPAPSSEALAEQAQELWDNVVMQVAVFADGLDLELSSDEIQTYMDTELGIVAPYDDAFTFDDERDLARYEAELQAVEPLEALRYYYSDEVIREQDADKPYYSSEDDEVPLDEAAFLRTLQVARYSNRALHLYLAGLDPDKVYQAHLDTIRKDMSAFIKKHGRDKRGKIKKKYPVRFHAVDLRAPEAWPAFTYVLWRALHEAPELRTQALSGELDTGEPGDPDAPGALKPTVYEYDFPLWKDATVTQVRYRGKILMAPVKGKGRSWPAITHSLHGLATDIGRLVAPTASPAQHGVVGNRVLATALLYILAGRGDEVQKTLAAKGFEEFAAAETVILEFLSLALGVESVRMPFCQLDTFLHLINVANRAGFGPSDRDYTFLNTWSWVRHFIVGPEHVYIEGSYSKTKKGETEHTKYAGFTRRPEAEAGTRLLTSDKDGPKKSKKSVGKSMYSHSAGHPKVLHLLGMPIAGPDRSSDTELDERTTKTAKRRADVQDRLWDQVRAVTPKTRRKLHQRRLASMGPIRVYNLFANFLGRYNLALGKLTPEQIGWNLVDAYRCFNCRVQPGLDNPFRDLSPTFSGASFETAVNTILQQEKVKPVDGIALGAIQAELAAETHEHLDQVLSTHDAELSLVAAYLVHTGWQVDKAGPLHLAVATGRMSLVELFLAAGADPEAENKDGETPQAMAIRLGHKKIGKLLKKKQDERRDAGPRQLPAAWAKFATVKPGRGGLWLDDQEVRTLVQARLPQLDVSLTPAVNIINNANLLATFIHDDYIAQMGGGAVRQYTVVPINFNNAHWATLVIDQNDDRRSQPTVYFFDSLGSDDARLNLIRTMLTATGVYTRAVLHDLSDSLQSDGYTCGTWMVESAGSIVEGLRAQQSVLTIGMRLWNFSLDTTATDRHAANLLAVRPPALVGGSSGASSASSSSSSSTSDPSTSTTSGSTTMSD